MSRKKAIILSANGGFAGLIGQVLEDTGAYQPVWAATAEEALQAAGPDLALLLLDGEMTARLDPRAVPGVMERAGAAKLVVIPNEDKPNDPDLAHLGADMTLPSPFYLPDLLTALEDLFGPLQPAAEEKRPSYGDPAPRVQAPDREPLPAPAWLQDVSEAASYLTRLSLESASHAALIVRDGELWAYAGELPRAAAEELAATVAEHALNGGGADLARFVHLKVTGADYMLYGTRLGADFSLALAFDAQAPLSKMRAQVSEAARALVSAPQAVLQQGGEAAAQPPASGDDFAEEEGAAPELPDFSTPPQPVEGKPLKMVTDGLRQPSLSYTYALIPRLPKHRLEGDLENRLAEWLPELCLAFAWKLESLSIHSGALEWTVRLPADKPPEVVARILDEHLSGRIFSEFPRLAQDNPSGEFWASGYLVVSGSELDPQTLSEHTHKVRARQGLAS